MRWSWRATIKRDMQLQYYPQFHHLKDNNLAVDLHDYTGYALILPNSSVSQTETNQSQQLTFNLIMGSRYSGILCIHPVLA